MKVNGNTGYLVIVVTILFVISGCTIPVPLPTNIMSSSSTTEATPTSEAMIDPLAEQGGAMATVATRSLRVRQAPDDNSEVVAGIAEGESYRVLALSDDGLWVQLAIDSALDGTGWVSTNFVSVEGDITDLTGTETTTEENAMQADPTATDVTLVPTPQSGFGVVTTDGVRLRVRSGPSTDDPIVGYIYDGESYQIIESSADGIWVRIPGATGSNTDNPDGGWVSAEYLIIGE